MNYRLIFTIASLGILMGVGSVTGIIHMGQEGPAWLVLGVLSATWIAFHVPERAFAHGFVSGLIAGSIAPLIQATFFNSYLEHNPAAAEAFRQLPAGASPRVLAVLMTPLLGLLSAFVLGAMSWAAHKARPRKVTAGA